MEIRNNEMRIGEKMIFFIDEYNILNIIPYGDIDTETALSAKVIINKLSTSIKGKVAVLMDLNNSGKQSTEARKTWEDVTAEHNASVALFGVHYVAKVIATFFIRFSKTKNTRFFNNREEALAWLREEQKTYAVV